MVHEGCLDASECGRSRRTGGESRTRVPDEVRLSVRERDLGADRRKADLALRAVERARNGPGSELKELRDKPSDAHAWCAVVDGLIGRLD